MEEKDLYEMRKLYNECILNLLTKHLEKYKGMRLGQALFNLKIIEVGKDPFYEEPDVTFKRVIHANDKIETENPDEGTVK
jgi:hypothetical protein